MKQTIYVDVLVIINIYINYGLLLLSSAVGGLGADRLKILLSSLFGGIYSLIILIPDISDTAVSVSRIPALAVMVLLAYGYRGRKEFIRAALCFFAVNLLFAGAMFMLWFFSCPANMYFNGGVVYFGIDALTLVLMTIAAYLIIRVISFFAKRSRSRSFTYFLTVHLSGKQFACKGFYDSGNSLCDPFSGEGVIIADVDLFEGMFSDEIFDLSEKYSPESAVRLIPVSTLSGTQLLPSLRAEKITVKGIGTDITLIKPVIALCREKIHGGEYGALLYSAVFENATKGEE